MQTHWHKAFNRDGKVGLELDFNLGRWQFGPLFSNDRYAVSFELRIGPFELAVDVWKKDGGW